MFVVVAVVVFVVVAVVVAAAVVAVVIVVLKSLYADSVPKIYNSASIQSVYE